MWISHALAGSSILISVICDASTLAAEALLAFMFSSAAGVFIAFMVLVLSFIPLALAAGVFVAFMVLVSGFIPLLGLGGGRLHRLHGFGLGFKRWQSPGHPSKSV